MNLPLATSRKKQVLACLGLLSLMLTLVPSSAATTFFAERVVATSPGEGQSTTLNDPNELLGGPTGVGPNSGAATGVFNLGVGGSITLGFGPEDEPSVIRDATGADFIVFENAFLLGGNPASSFADLVFVEVSSNGIDFARFPITAPSTTINGLFGTIDPTTASGFAGTNPVLANVDINDINPFDPLVAGGDAFDLADLAALDAVIQGVVDLQNIRFLRLIDVLGDGSLPDSAGNPIFDDAGIFDNGADLDAVAVIHGVSVPEPTSLMALLSLASLMPLRRRRQHRL